MPLLIKLAVYANIRSYQRQHLGVPGMSFLAESWKELVLTRPLLVRCGRIYPASGSTGVAQPNFRNLDNALIFPVESVCGTEADLSCRSALALNRVAGKS